MAHIHFRPARVEDADAIKLCFEHAYRDALREIQDLPDVTEGLADTIETHQVVLAEQNSDLLGVIMFDQVGDKMMIFNLAVSPEAQGQGLARRLMQFAEDRARELGCAKLRLRTHRRMTGTIAMYLHMGWVEVDRTGNGITMEKLVCL